MTAPKPHLVLIGGFLGAGKTSAMIAFGEWLADQGIRAGFITNDQGTDLVDTRLLEYCGLATEEIAGGCFCCRFNELVDATHRLRAVLRPDVFVAEAVGSCTDLMATVSRPIQRLLADECTIGPLSVLVDPVRVRRAFGLDTGETLSEDVQYIYRKQLEEADLIVVTKRELPTAADLDELVAALRREFPHATVLAVSSHERIHLDEWFRRMLFDAPRGRAAMDVDYDRYAAGEASLGWLNASVRTDADDWADERADGNALLVRMADELQRRLSLRGAAVAHLKMTLQSGDQLAAINLVRSDIVPEPGVQMSSPVRTANLTVNLRAEAAPEVLEEVLRDSLAAIAGWRFDIVHVEAFRPSRPEPMHRDTVTPPST